MSRLSLSPSLGLTNYFIFNINLNSQVSAAIFLISNIVEALHGTGSFDNQTTLLTNIGLKAKLIVSALLV